MAYGSALFTTELEQRRAIALDIHKVLQPAATDLEKKKIEVQLVCKGAGLPLLRLLQKIS